MRSNSFFATVFACLAINAVAGKLPPTHQLIKSADSCMQMIRQGDTAAASAIVLRLIKVADQIPDSYARGNIFRVAANYYGEKWNYEKAGSLYNKAYETASKLPPDDKEKLKAITLFNHSLIFYQHGDYQQAISMCLEANHYYQMVNDNNGIAETSNRLGGLYLLLLDKEKAAFYNRKAYLYSLKSDDKNLQSLCLNAYGNYLLAQENTDSALIMYKKAIESALESGHKKLIADAYYNISYCYSGLEKFEEALNMIKLSHQWSMKSGNQYDICDTRYKTGLLLYYMNKPGPARDTLLNALKEASLLNSPMLQRNIYDALTYLEAENGNHKLAWDYLNKYIDFQMLIFSEEDQKQVAYQNARYDAEKREADILRQKAMIQRRNFILILAGIMLLALAITIIMGIILQRRKHRIAEQELIIRQQKIAELEKEKELVAVQSTLKGEETERSRIARDLHDGLGGMLSGVKLSLTNMNGSQILDEDNARLFEQAINLIDSSVKELRWVAHNMMPEILLKEGLNEALESFCRSFSGPPEIRYHAFGESMRFEKGFELTVYRVVQELVNNALKHSSASEIVVELIQEPERISLNVRDNGIGFDPGISYFSGHGLSNIRSRIASYSGLFDISSREGQGSEAMISFNDTKPYVRNN